MVENSYSSVKAILCGAILLLSALLLPESPSVSFQDASAQEPDKPREKGKVPKIDSETLHKRNQALVKKEAAAGAASAVDELRVVLELDGAPSPGEIEELAKLGIRIEGKRESLIQALVPSTQLDILAKMDFIKYIRQPLYVVPALVSQGAFAIGANETNAAGFTGQGIKVAVIDLGFDLANPEIAPNVVETKSFRGDEDIRTSDPSHGTAVAEIIVDVAPAVQLFLYNVDTDISLLNALDYIVDQNTVDIVSMSLGIYNAGPLDGTSEISQAVDAIRNSGILFVTAAGNEAQRHWKGNFADPNSDGWHNFSGADQTIGISTQMGQVVDVFLSWDDWPTSTQDYDLYVLDNTMTLIKGSENPQDLGYYPKEQITFVAEYTGIYHIGIFKFSATQDVTFDLFTYPVSLNEYNVPSGSLIIPADAAGALTVGAVFWEDGELEAFSSRGPTNDGRIKPDISGPDGVTTSALNPFFGSSAATPHVSGAAALVKDVYPGADASTIQSLLEQNTLNNHVKNNDDGTGMVHVSFLLAGIPVAHAGGDQIVNENSMVILNGNLSTDSDGTIVSYLWEQVNGTVTVDLTDAGSAIASFTAPSVTADIELVFKLTVIDNLGASGFDTATIIVKNVNQEPVADAGSDQVVEEGTLVTLNGTGSTDPDGDTLTFSWTQTAGPVVTLSGADTATASFTAPDVDSLGATLTFELTVTDNEGLTSTDTVDVIVQNVNQPPVANAGPDQTVDEGTIVTLDGTASIDLDSDVLTFLWVQTGGPGVTLSGADTATPSFTAPEVDSAGTTLTFELTVDDGNGGSATDTVDVIVNNVPVSPIADAGVDQSVDEGTVVILNGTGSSDPDGTIASYSWIQVNGTLVELIDADTATPSFTAPEVGTDGDSLTFELTVSDNDGLTSTDTVTVVVQNVNQAPVADAGLDQVVDEGAIVVLNGTGSSDPDGDSLTYSWVQTGGPLVVLEEPTSATPSFTAPEVGSAGATLTFELTVSDGIANSTDTVDIMVNDVAVNQPPVANAGPDQAVDEGTTVTLNGTGSSDPDGDPITYSWMQTGGAVVLLNDPTSPTPSFTAPEVGTDGDILTFELIVDDGNGGTATDTVNVIVQNVNQPPVANAGAGQTVNEGDVVTLDGTASSDPDGDPITYSWVQTAGPIVTLTGADTANPSFTAPLVDSAGAVLTFQLTVDDGNGGSAADSVDIVVNNVPVPPIADAGLVQTVDEGTLVILDGTASSDADGDILSYSWVQINGTSVELDDPTSATPSFLAPAVGAAGAVLTFELTVTDNDSLTSTDTVTVVVQNVNQPPVADAGLDQIVIEGDLVTLDGTASSDLDGDDLTYSWTQINGTLVELTGADTATPSFTAPEVDSTGATLTFELTVSDGVANSTDTVSVVIGNVNQAPVADAGADQTVNEGDLVDLNGSGSSDPDGDPITYSWIQTAGPAVILSDTTSATPSFTAPEVDSTGTTLTFELTVTDNDGLTGIDIVNVIVQNVNQPPVANAGPDQTVNEGTIVTLDGTGSSDPDGDTLAYSWIQTVGPAVELLNSDTPSPSFTAPEVSVDGNMLTFELTVSDGIANSTDTVDIMVNDVAVNQPPVANAGPDQAVDEGTTVTLNGTGSSDPDGDPITYSWIQTAGPEVSLDVSTSPTPSFVAPAVNSAGAVLTFQLTVDDGNGGSAADSVDIVVNNVPVPPIADAGSDQTVEEGTLVTLNGTGSIDPDGTIESHSWIQVNGTLVELTGADTATASFTAPEVDSLGATLTFELTVTDNEGLTSTDSVNIIVQNVNQSPVADAGSDQTVNEGDVVTLNGTNSLDPDGDPISYSWTQIAGPAVTLDGADTSTPSFTAPEVNSTGAVLTFELTVSDGTDNSTDNVSINIQNVNQLPVADAGPDQTVNEGISVTLNGTASSDPDGEPLTYSWLQTNGTSVELDDPTSPTPTFTAPEVNSTGTTLTFELTVSDGVANSTDSVDVTVNDVAVNQPPVANAGPDQTVNEGTIVTLDGTGSSDPDGVIVSYLWQQESGPVVSLSNTSSPSTTFLAPLVDANTILTFRLNVTDNDNASATDTVVITVNNVVAAPSGGGGGGGGGGGAIAQTESPTESTATTFPATFFALNPLAKIIMQILYPLNWFGMNTFEASGGQQMLVSSMLINQQQVPQDYVYIVQITDDKGFAVEIMLQNGTAEAGQTLQVSSSWTPPATGMYTIDIFIWDGLTETPAPLSDVGHRTITVI